MRILGIDPGTMVTGFGVVDDSLIKAFDIRQEVFYADFSWNMIMKISREAVIVSKPVPKYPEVRRDLSLLIDKEITFEQIRDIAVKSERKLLRAVGLFDVYEGYNIGAD